eukprot:CAMPEP_0182495770 /NCGR_PEP_ID=MMETSP1321-20130603/4515_1 /TAXON_ID=91990 /ORGANISM="Bolidomonas sp., Strain RCC1657" /LENGTH=63 /DNA_ID=CAMNT_0024699221 /DNA_START=10 /DNA_END=201 /DNA_ORIENTATION=-
MATKQMQIQAFAAASLFHLADAWGKKKVEIPYSYTLEYTVGGFFAICAVLTIALVVKGPPKTD